MTILPTDLLLRACLAFCTSWLVSWPAVSVGQSLPGVPTMGAPISPAPVQGARPAPSPAAASPGTTSPRTIGWDALVPADWDPMKDLKGLNLSNRQRCHLCCSQGRDLGRCHGAKLVGLQRDHLRCGQGHDLRCLERADRFGFE